jgi:hypothetical protein|tara:strand:- start:1801 stop:2028 length:228 start_codon:yes stop_codon:yes gene_type:complete
MELQDKVLKIVGYKTWSDKRKIDALLEIDANAYTNLGTDSTKTDRENTRRDSRFIYRAIKSIDEPLGRKLLVNQC